MSGPDPIFADARLAAVYDAFDGERSDLDAYAALADELDAETVLDVGCGTGALALRLAARGVRVVAADPAAASLEVARAKPGADRVRWVGVGAADLADVVDAGSADLALMTGNVAQVFVDDAEWHRVLRALACVVRPGGTLAFETRVPERRAWLDWASDRRGVEVRDVPGVGRVEQRFELRRVAGPLVWFRLTYRFADGSSIGSDSTLVFRDRPQVERDLADAGLRLRSVREAADRPGLEHVYLSRREG